MYNDVSLWAKSGRFQAFIKDLYAQGFNIYKTSDHGYTPCIGAGRITSRGEGTEFFTIATGEVYLYDRKRRE